MNLNEVDANNKNCIPKLLTFGSVQNGFYKNGISSTVKVENRCKFNLPLPESDDTINQCKTIALNTIIDN